MAFFFGASLTTLLVGSVADATIRVAVLEHRVQNRSTAALTMEANLKVYETQIEEAGQRGAKLLVTPEDGITGFRGNQRDGWWDYAAKLPEVDATASPLCQNASVFWPLRRLSCLASRYEVAVVASLVDMKECAKDPHFPGCDQSRDGWLLLNTAVVVDSDGRLIQKYHKANLWGETALDESKECSPKSFRVSGFEVTFGIFICADLIHAWPALELIRQGVRHFVMPLSWSNEMAQMQPLGWQQAWSYQMKAVLLVANTRRTQSCSGSGIYLQGEAKAHAYDLRSDAADDELLVAEVPLQLSGPTAAPRWTPPGRPLVPLPAHGVQWQSFQLDMTPGDHSSVVCSAFQATFSSSATCCRVSYRSRRQGKGYALAVINGLDISGNVAPWAAEACAVLPCDASGGDCLTYPTQALSRYGAQWFGEFDFLEMEVNFSTPQEVFPQVLATSQRLLPPDAWHFSDGRMAINGSWAEELVSFQLYGRPYWKDSDAQQHCPVESASSIRHEGWILLADRKSVV